MVILFSLLTSTLAVMAMPLIAETRGFYQPNSSHVYIADFSYIGTGCPKGSAAPRLSTDNQTSVKLRIILFNSC